MSRRAAPRSDWDRIDASTSASALDDLHALGALADGADVSSICAVLDDNETDAAVTRDERVALVSVLVVRGVMAFETSDPQTVTRILDAHAALSAGEIEVLDS